MVGKRFEQALRRGAGPARRTRFTMPQSDTLALSSFSTSAHGQSDVLIYRHLFLNAAGGA